MSRQFMMIFDRPKGRRWALVAPGGSPEEGTTHQEAQARPGGLCPPQWPPAPPLCSINTPIFQKP